MGLLNAAMLGRGAFKGNMATPLIAVPAKDLAVSAGLNLPTFAAAARKYTETPPAPAPSINVQPATSSFADAMNWVGQNKLLTGGMGLGALGLLGGAGYLTSNALHSMAAASKNEQGGRIRVTLPTRKPGDAETQLDMPMQQVPLSNALFGKLQRDVRTRLHRETKERTRVVHLSPEEKQRRAMTLMAARGMLPSI